MSKRSAQPVEPELLHLADDGVEEIAERDSGSEGRYREPSTCNAYTGPRTDGPENDLTLQAHGAELCDVSIAAESVASKSHLPPHGSTKTATVP